MSRLATLGGFSMGQICLWPAAVKTKTNVNLTDDAVQSRDRSHERKVHNQCYNTTTATIDPLDACPMSLLRRRQLIPILIARVCLIKHDNACPKGVP